MSAAVRMLGALVACLQLVFPTQLSGRATKPKLIVQITMDQLRGDLLRDYQPALTGGFRRLEGDGYWVMQGEVDFGLTLSFPGHAALATGMHPSHHGLTANEWWIERNGRWLSSDVTDDERFRILNRAEPMGASPSRMTATTLGEWVKSADPRAKSIALGAGDRIPIAYAGHRTDAAYWYDTSLNAFTTSTFYAQSAAGWITSFNRTQLSRMEPRVWELTVPQPFIALADTRSMSLHGVTNGTFPHKYDLESQTGKGDRRPYGRWFGSTPMKDEALFALALRALEEEQLGQRGATDYLAIDIDTTDNVGHQYGPRSLEQLDTLVRLDRALGRFLDRLDIIVGRGQYVVALAADHGVADPPQARPGWRTVTIAEVDAALDRVERVAVRDASKNRSSLLADITAELARADFIADVYTEERLSGPANDPYLELYKRNFRPGLTTDFPLWSNRPRDHHPARYGITVRFKEGAILDAAVGVHGSPYSYDRDVPIVFYGMNIRRGRVDRGGRTVDVAPTVAAAAGVPAPNGLDGHPLTDALAATPGQMFGQLPFMTRSSDTSSCRRRPCG